MATVLVTGSDRGIGAALVRAFHHRGDRVFAACLGDGAHLVEEHVDVLPRVDVTDVAALARVRERLGDTRLDVLISNAGAFHADAWGAFDYAAMMDLYDVNALGPLRVVDALASTLVAGSKVGIITSRVGSIADNTSGGSYGYRMSKCAANMLGMNLYHELHPRGIAVVVLHPGQVATEMTRGLRDTGHFVTPEIAAAGLIERIDELDPNRPLEFRHADGTLLPW